jgi:hypothetical protein
MVMVRRWRSRMRSRSGVRRSAYSGKNFMTGSSTPARRPRSMAAPTRSAVTVLVTERMSWMVSGPKAMVPSQRPQRSSSPVK